MVQPCRGRSEEGAPAAFLLETTEEVWDVHCGEHSDWLHHRLCVRKPVTAKKVSRIRGKFFQKFNHIAWSHNSLSLYDEKLCENFSYLSFVFPERKSYKFGTNDIMVATLWRCEANEQVVAHIKALPYKFTIVLRHADFLTLRPHELLNGYEELHSCYPKQTRQAWETAPAKSLHHQSHFVWTKRPSRSTSNQMGLPYQPSNKSPISVPEHRRYFRVGSFDLG
ncbi:uncharacterized protein LOC127421801 [Myxocyprinus asiaticus]|uniref:uncharacterized protein LOC127421801 n=1 Tax=Myxocyprinus asiaticus TaxID=70543 RepID=UPI0022217DA0|nr:uncharacterized protein LOC127421801 [Myxocyprinus asiaticus]